MASPSLPLWTDAFLADTTHLTTAEIGAYMLMLMTAWRTPECHLRNDEKYLARVTRQPLVNWRRMAPTLLGFWIVDATGMLTQKRLQREWNFVGQRAEKNRVAANVMWGAKRLKNNDTDHADASAAHMRNGCTDDAPKPTIVRKKKAAYAAKEESEPPHLHQPEDHHARTHGSRLPDDWRPDDGDRAFAGDLGLDPEHVAAEFADHWRAQPGQRGRKADWPATWRNWCRRARPQRAIGPSATARGIDAAFARRSLLDR